MIKYIHVYLEYVGYGYNACMLFGIYYIYKTGHTKDSLLPGKLVNTNFKSFHDSVYKCVCDRAGHVSLLHNLNMLFWNYIYRISKFLENTSFLVSTCSEVEKIVFSS